MQAEIAITCVKPGFPILGRVQGLADKDGGGPIQGLSITFCAGQDLEPWGLGSNAHTKPIALHLYTAPSIAYEAAQGVLRVTASHLLLVWLA